METTVVAQEKVLLKTFTKVMPTYCCFPDNNQEGNGGSKNIVLCYVNGESMSDIVQILESNQKLDPENNPSVHSGTYREVFKYNNQPVYQRV